MSFQLCTNPLISKISSKIGHTKDFALTMSKNSPNMFISKDTLFNFSSLKCHLTASLASNVERTSSSAEFPEGLKKELMPKHIALIADGNRRWARRKMLPKEDGYTALPKVTTQLAMNCSKLGVKVLTVFLFAVDNWKRPSEETDLLMSVFEEMMKSDFQDLITVYDMQISVIGDKSRLPLSLQSVISTIEESTMGNKGMHLLVALSYGGRNDITRASKNIARKVENGILKVEDINEALFGQHLLTGDVEYPDPDLCIRTSGESRISNFLLWQMSFSELYFSNKMFPEFEEADLVDAIRVYQGRDRRLGGEKF